MPPMSDSYLLSDIERERFAAWLERQAETGKQMIEQFKKLPPMVADAMVKKESLEVAAYLVVARVLRSTESMTLTAQRKDADG